MYKIYKCDPDFSGMLAVNLEKPQCSSDEVPIGAVKIHAGCFYKDDLIYTTDWLAEYIDTIPETDEVQYNEQPVLLIGEELPALAEAIYKCGVIDRV